RTVATAGAGGCRLRRRIDGAAGSAVATRKESMMPNSTAPIRRLHRLRLRNGMYGRHGKVVVAALLVAMAATAPARTDEPTDQDIFWQRLQELCGRAFAGTMTAYDATADADWLGQSIVAHLRRCT